MFGLELLGSPVATTLVIGASTLVLLYWYSTRNHHYWKKKGVPYAKPYPLLGSLVETMRTPVHEVEIRRYKQLGKIYGHFSANKPLLSVADPDLIKEVLVKDFSNFSNRRTYDSGNPVIDNMLIMLRGEDWKRIRSIVSPTFSTGKIKRLLGILKDCSTTLIENMKQDSKTEKPFNAKRLFGAFTMDVIASSAFSTKIDTHNDPDNQFVKHAKGVFYQKFNWRAILYIVAPRLSKCLGIGVSTQNASVFFKEVTLKIVEDRKKTGQTRNDFLQLLMDTATELAEDKKLDLTEKEEGDIAANYGEDVSGDQVFKNIRSKYLSEDELVSQCLTFFLAGYDTSANTLSCVCYMLAMNPDAQDRLRTEVDEVLKGSKGELTHEVIQNMKYLDNVISETLRIYTPIYRLQRLAYADYQLGNTGITVEKGTLITIPIYAIHRDPQLYPDPETFDPDRFTPEERAKRIPYTYLPFGSGARQCVAMRFALLELQVCITHVISHFILQRSPQTQVPLQFQLAHQVFMQPKEILLDLKLRKDSPLLQ